LPSSLSGGLSEFDLRVFGITARTRVCVLKDFIVRHKWPLIVAAVTVLMRLLYLYEISLQADFAVPMVDEKWHWEWAHAIINQSFWGEGAYFRAPLYPYLLAFLAWVTGSSIFWAKALQTLISAGTAVFVFLIGARLVNRPTGIISGLAYALYGTLIFYETMFLIPVTFLFFLSWAMYRVVAHADSPSAKTWLVTGLIFGLAAISRPNVLLVIPLLMLWMFYAWRRERGPVGRVRLPVVLLVGVIAAVAPVTVRNIVVTGEFILISSQGGINLYLGNNPVADGLTMVMPEVDLDESVSWRRFGAVTAAAAEHETGRRMSESELSSFWAGKAVDFIAYHPDRFLTLLWKKTVYLVSGFENSDNIDIYHQRGKSLLLSALLWKGPLFFPFGLLLPLAVMGVCLQRQSLRRLLPVYIFLLAYVPSIVLFLVTARHRLPLVPFLIILAAGGLVELLTEGRRLPVRKLVAGGVVFILLVLALNRTYYDEGIGGDFQNHFNAGIAYEQTGDLENAQKAYHLADESYPYSATVVNNLGHVQFRLGRLSEAKRNYLRAIRLDPGFAPAYNNLGLLVRSSGNVDSALVLFQMALDRFDTTVTPAEEIAQVHLNMAETQEKRGMLAVAAACFELAVTTAPDMGKAYCRAAAFYARHGSHERADSLFETARQMDALAGSDFFNWGLSYLGQKRHTEGIAAMRQALEYDSSLHQAWYCIAAAMFESGEPADTVNYYIDRCLRLNPNDASALRLKAAVNR